MKKWKGLLVLCCVALAGTALTGCVLDGSNASTGSGSESVVPNGEITVKFDPCTGGLRWLKDKYAVGAEAGKR